MARETGAGEMELDPRPVRLLVLRGAGEKAFVAGTDISQFQTFSTEADALAYEQKVNRYASRLETLRKPVIAIWRSSSMRNS